MTAQEAKIQIECIPSKIWEQLSPSDNEAIEIAIEALEKQIPKKPILEGDGYDPEGNLVYDTWYCPNCDKDYEVDYEEHDYCPNCGQHINWSE